jgi:hypothetical protein
LPWDCTDGQALAREDEAERRRIGTEGAGMRPETRLDSCISGAEREKRENRGRESAPLQYQVLILIARN